MVDYMKIQQCPSPLTVPLSPFLIMTGYDNMSIILVSSCYVTVHRDTERIEMTIIITKPLHNFISILF